MTKTKHIDYKLAREKAFELCSRLEKCKSDVSKKLKDWGLDENQCRNIMEELMREKYIDESRFAKLFAESKMKYNHWGKYRIEMELKKRGIEHGLIKEAIEHIDDGEYEKKIALQLKKKAASITIQNPYKRLAALLRFAAARGYSAEHVYKFTGLREQDV